MVYNSFKIYSLEESVMNQITGIANPFIEYFYSDLRIKRNEINKFSDEKIKLKALTDLHDEAIQFYRRYVANYTKYINDLEKFTLFDDIDDVTIENCSISNRESTDKIYIKDSIEYLEFWETDMQFDAIINDLMEELKETAFKIELAEKYHIKNKIKKPKIEVAVDIHTEFIKLFTNQKGASDFIMFLKNHEYITSDEKWIGRSQRPGELRDAYYVLLELQLIRQAKYHINSLRIFYRRFGLDTHEKGSKAYISERSLRNKDYTKDREAFSSLLVTSQLTTKIKSF